jgi:hypothetical protein
MAMSAREWKELDKEILGVLAAGIEGSPKWLRFLAARAAARLGHRPEEAEQSLRRLHDRGCLALAFGFERGDLSDLGVLVARRVGRRPARYAITVERPPAHPRAS